MSAVGSPRLLQWLAGRLFIPLTLAMGVDVGVCVRVATLLGVRATLNELVAHARHEALEGQLPVSKNALRALRETE